MVYASTVTATAAVKRNAKLKKHSFGRTGWQVTEVCGGTMTWGSFNGKEEMAWEQLDKLYELGVNFIDTAELYPVAFNYGKTTEEWIGNWLRQRVKEGRVDRSSLYFATKCNPNGVGASMPGREGPHGYDVEMLEHSCRASLARLSCDVIDLYQLHWPSRDTPMFGCAGFYPEGFNRPMKYVDMGEAYAKERFDKGHDGGMGVFERQVSALKTLFDKGLIKQWGLSNENAYGITMFCLACDKLGVPRPVSCQNDFSLLNRTYECDTWEAAYRFGVVGLPYGPLAGGVLTGKYGDAAYNAAEGRPLDQSRMTSRPDFQPRYGMPAAMLATDEYVALAEAYGITPTQLALAWAKQRPCNANGSIIIGTTTVRQVEECVSAFKLELPDELMAAIDVIHEQYRNPSMYYCDKAVCMKAAHLGTDAWTAMSGRPSGGLTLLRSPTMRMGLVAAAAATAAVAVASMMRR